MQIKNIKLFPKDFSHLKAFPGLEGNPFDIVLKWLGHLQEVSTPIFLLILIGISLVPSLIDFRMGAILLIFTMGDWIMMEQLPRQKISFGPPKPVTLQLAILRMVFIYLPFPINCLAQLCGSCLVIYGFWIEPHRVRVSYHEISTPKLAAGSKFRFLHISDLHIERSTRREIYIREMIESLDIDAIFFSGDILNLSYVDDQLSWEEARKFLQSLGEKKRLYFVSGSPAVDIPENLPKLLEGMPLFWMQGKKVEILCDGGSVIDLIGLSCTHQPHIDAPHLLKIIGDDQDGKYKILLYHSPDLAPHAAEFGIDLYLSGHTHGGQVCMPIFGPLFTGSLYGRIFDSGLMQVGNMALYISRGIGMEGAGAPWVRFLCPPEIIVWEIRGKGKI